MSTIYKCDRCGKEMNKIHNRLKEVVIEGKSRFEGTKYFEPETLDFCEECYKDFKSFMFGPDRDLDSKTTLRPWSEVGDPPKINGVPLAANDDSDSDEVKEPHKIEGDCYYCKYRDYSWDEEPCCNCKLSVFANGEEKNSFEPKKEETDSRYSTDVDILANAKYKIDAYIRSDDDEGDIYKIVSIALRDDGEIVYNIRDLSTNTYLTLSERDINNWYTVIVKYSCDGCKLEGTDDCMCDTCIVGDPKGPRRQWWKPKEEEG